MKRTMLLFGSLVLLIFLLGCAPPPRNQIPPEAINGALHLGNWDIEEDGLVVLSGEWLFYWNELYTPSDLTQEIQQTASAVSVPEDWDEYEQIANPTPNGYATYQLQLTGLVPNQLYGLYVDSPNTSYRLWVNGEELLGQGKVGRTRAESNAVKIAATTYFQSETAEADLVIQVANFFHRDSGLTNEIILDTPDRVNNILLWGRGEDAFLFGVLFIIAFYHFGIFFFRLLDKAPLYFAILIGLIALRVAVSNEKIILLLFPNLDWNILLRIDYLTFYWAPPLFAAFIYTLYPKDVSRLFVRLYFLPTAVFSLFVFTLPLLDLSYHPIAYQIVFFIGMVYMVWVLGRIIYFRREGATLITIATITLALTAGLDVFSTRDVIDATDLAPYGFLFAIFVQAILIAKRFSSAFTLVETTQQELKQSEEKYRTFFEESHDLVYLIGPNARIEDASPSSVEILGYTREELQTMRMHDVVVGQQVSEMFTEAITDENAIRNRELRLRRKDGRIIDALFTATWRYDEQGHRVGMQGILRDITGVKRERAMERARDRAEAANKAKSTFLANMSHEIRTPLNTIIGYTEMIKDDAPYDGVPQYVPDLNRVLQSSNHLLSLINDVLDISKVEAGKMQLHITSFHLASLIRSTGADAEALMMKNSNRLVVSVDDRLDTMHGDETKVRQILFNLLSNAAKFTHEGKVSLVAKPDELNGKPAVTITVTDSGIGMTAEQLNTLFEAFVQADETISSNYGGTGLGMALTKQICELMGGTITAESEKNFGTTFTVTLPLNQSTTSLQE